MNFTKHAISDTFHSIIWSMAVKLNEFYKYICRELKITYYLESCFVSVNYEKCAISKNNTRHKYFTDFFSAFDILKFAPLCNFRHF